MYMQSSCHWAVALWSHVSDTAVLPSLYYYYLQNKIVAEFGHNFFFFHFVEQRKHIDWGKL